MLLWKKLWNDEAGLLISAEAVTVGTVGVLAATVGLSSAATAVNDELFELASAFRSLDQSYSVAGDASCGAWKAGSSYIQQPVEQSLADLCADTRHNAQILSQRIEDHRQQLVPAGAREKAADKAKSAEKAKGDKPAKAKAKSEAKRGKDKPEKKRDKRRHPELERSSD